MLASWPDDGPDARKYELSYGRCCSERLSDSLQGLHDPGEPSSYDWAKKLTAESYNHRIVTERSVDERRWQPSSGSMNSMTSRLSWPAGRLTVRVIMDGLLHRAPFLE